MSTWATLAAWPSDSNNIQQQFVNRSGSDARLDGHHEPFCQRHLWVAWR